MWFWLSLITLLCWSGCDLFSKIGCRDARTTSYSHLKMVIAVGTVMGLHAAFEIFVSGTPISLVRDLDVSPRVPALHRLHGPGVPGPAVHRALRLLPHLQFLRGSGGGFDPALCGRGRLLPLALCAIAAGLRRRHRPRRGGRHARTRSSGPSGRRTATTSTPRASWPWPCRWPTACWTPPAPSPTTGCWRLSLAYEDCIAPTCAYELTFLAAAVVCFVYVVLIRKDQLIPRLEAPKYTGRHLRDGRPVRLHLRHRGHRAIWPCPPPSSPPTARRPSFGAASS